jgi:hypothetical protein
MLLEKDKFCKEVEVSLHDLESKLKKAVEERQAGDARISELTAKLDQALSKSGGERGGGEEAIKGSHAEDGNQEGADQSVDGLRSAIASKDKQVETLVREKEQLEKIRLHMLSKLDKYEEQLLSRPKQSETDVAVGEKHEQRLLKMKGKVNKLKLKLEEMKEKLKTSKVSGEVGGETKREVEGEKRESEDKEREGREKGEKEEEKKEGR